MAQTAYDLRDIPQIPDAEIAIIQSKWHSNYSDVMVSKCIAALEATACKTPSVHQLPGCFELPLAARDVARNNKSLEAIIVFGIIIKGDTYHFEMVMEETVRGLGKVMFECNIPVINEILPVTSEQQVIDRCGDNDSNKGLEAAIAAAEMISWRRNNAA